MELFFYSCDTEAPFRELYKSLNSQNNKLLISNQEKHISKFKNYKDRILYEAIGDDVTDKKILVPIEVKDVFLGWLKEKYVNSSYKLVEFINTEEFHLTGADEINTFIDGMNIKTQITGADEINTIIDGMDMKTQKSIFYFFKIILILCIIGSIGYIYFFKLEIIEYKINQFISEQPLIKINAQNLKRKIEDLHNAETKEDLQILIDSLEPYLNNEKYKEEANNILVAAEDVVLAINLQDSKVQQEITKQEKINSLLKRAKIALIKTNFLTSSKGEDTVVELVGQILYIDSKNTEVKKLIKDTINKYLILAKRNIKIAEEFLENIEKIRIKFSSYFNVVDKIQEDKINDLKNKIKQLKNKPKKVVEKKKINTEQKFKELLQKARKALNNKLLLDPPHDNAYKWAKEAKKIKTKSGDIIRIVSDIIDTYIGYIESNKTGIKSKKEFYKKVRTLSHSFNPSQKKKLRRLKNKYRL